MAGGVSFTPVLLPIDHQKLIGPDVLAQGGAGRRYVEVEDLPADQKCMAEMKLAWKPDGEPFLGPKGPRMRQGREAVLWLQRTGVRPAMARRLLTDGTVQRRRVDYEGNEIPAEWMWPDLSQDQVKKYSSAKKDGLKKRRGSTKGKLKGVGDAARTKCEKKQALAVATSEQQAGGKSVVDKAERSKLQFSLKDKRRVVGAVIQQRLWNPELHKDDSRLGAAIVQATKQILQQSGQLTWQVQLTMRSRTCSLCI